MSVQSAACSQVPARAVITACAGLLLSAAGQADDSGPVQSSAASSVRDDVVTEVIVSATRTVRELDSVPASATVVSAEVLESRTFDSLDEALNFEAGMYDGRMRGVSSTSHTLVMLNGMPLNSGWYGGIRWDNIAMENVERIEIVRGPGSALYGGNAMGGTVNIITKLPQAFEAGVKTRVGSDANRSYGGSIGDKFFERFAVRLGVEYDDELVGRPTEYVFRPVTAGVGSLQGGEFSYNRTGSPYWIVGDEGERNERQWSVNLAASYELSATGALRLEAQEGYSDYRNGPPHSYVTDAAGQPVFSGSVVAGPNLRATLNPSQFLNGEGVDENSSYMLTYSDTLGRVDLVSKLGYQHEDKWYTSVTANSGNYDTASGNVREFDTDTYFVDVQATLPIGNYHTLTSGIYLRQNTFDQGQFDIAHYREERRKTSGKTELTQGTDRYYAVYAQDEIALGSSVKAYIGGRYDQWEAYDGLSGPAAAPLRLADTDNSAFSPGASLVWDVSAATVLRASIAKAFSAPTLYDLYRTYASNNQLILGNPQLQSESLVNYELGLVQYVWDKRLRLALTGFQMNYRNLVYSHTYDDVADIDNNPVTTLVSTNANAGQARNRGFELVANFKPLDWLEVWGNYSENHTRITRNELAPATVGKRFTYSPDRTSSVGVDARRGWLHASLSANYTGRIFRTADNTDTVAGVYQTETIGWLTDAKVSATVPMRTLGLRSGTFALSIKNLFDAEYFDYYIGRPRSYYLETNLKF